MSAKILRLFPKKTPTASSRKTLDQSETISDSAAQEIKRKLILWHQQEEAEREPHGLRKVGKSKPALAVGPEDEVQIRELFKRYREARVIYEQAIAEVARRSGRSISSAAKTLHSRWQQVGKAVQS